MDVDDVEATVAEAGRVLEPGGALAVSVTHPVNDAGDFESSAPDARFAIEGTYFGKQRLEETLTRGGLEMTFRSWRYQIEAYALALERGGFAIERLREPAAPADPVVGERPADERWQRLPMFLWLPARKARA